MGLPKIIQIPCHHLLANQNALKFKKGAPLKQFFNINLGIGIIKKTTFFCLYFGHISLWFYSNFDRKSSLDAKINSASNEWPLDLLLTNLDTPKTRNTWKMWRWHFWQTLLPQKQEILEKMWWWHHHHIFLGISFFW